MNDANEFQIQDSVLVKYTGSDKQVAIPAGVTALDAFAFFGCADLESVTVPDSVTKVGAHAFEGCKRLNHVMLRKSVKAIEEAAFWGCESLTDIQLPLFCDQWAHGEFEKYLPEATIWQLALEDPAYKKLREHYKRSPHKQKLFARLIREQRLDQLSRYLNFWSKINLEDLRLCLITAKDSQNAEALSLLRDYRRDQYPEVDEDWLETPVDDLITFQAEIRDCRAVITGCENMTPHVVIPATVQNAPVTEIGKLAFADCKELTDVELPDGVTTIQDSAFHECEQLASVVLPDGLTCIGKMAFFGCRSLKQIALPDGLAQIQDWAFSGCEKLKTVTIRESVTHIGTGAFSECVRLTSVLLPSGVTRIEPWTFAGCERLAKLVLPSGVTQIGSNAFSNCKGLKSIRIPNSVETIEEDAFAGCDALTIQASAGSCAETYAKENRIPFEAK